MEILHLMAAARHSRSISQVVLFLADSDTLGLLELVDLPLLNPGEKKRNPKRSLSKWKDLNQGEPQVKEGRR